MLKNNHLHHKVCLGTPTCHSISSYSIPFHLTALLPLSVPQSTHTDLVNGSLTSTANHSLTPSFYVYFHEQRKRLPASVLQPTGHAYQLCQPANGKADWTAGDRNERSPFGPTRFILPQGSDVRNVLAGWGSSGWIDLPCPLQSVCQRHAPTLAPRPVGPLR